MSKQPIALVTGGNRGIGLEVCRALGRAGHPVVLTARSVSAGEAAAGQLCDAGLEVCFEPLDVGDEASVLACRARLASAHREVGILVNNAGIYGAGALLEASSESLREAMEVNVLGAAWTCRAFVPGMIERGYGRVVNVSSGYGSFSEGLEGPAAYAVSKAALNALTLKLASEVRGDVKVNAVCPGWVRTRMGGPTAPRAPEEAAADIAWAATLPSDGPHGQFLRHRQQVPW